MVEMVWGWHKVDLASIKEGSAVEVLIILIKTITPDFRDIGIGLSPRKPDSPAARDCLVTENVAPSPRKPDSLQEPINGLCNHTGVEIRHSRQGGMDRRRRNGPPEAGYAIFGKGCGFYSGDGDARLWLLYLVLVQVFKALIVLIRM